VILCLVMGRPYQFYYFVPLVTFWFLVLYVVLLVYPKVTAELVKGNLFEIFFCAGNGSTRDSSWWICGGISVLRSKF
jgi:hypothetical protein